MAIWKECTLSEIGKIVGGATPSTKKEENYGGDIPWITPKDLSNFSGRYISRGERNITEKGLKSCSTQIMPKNSILFSSRAPIGYVAIADNDLCTNQGFKSVVPNDNINPLFVYYLLKFNKDKIEGLGSGTTFKEVSGTTMKNVIVKVPETIEDQRRISSILDAIDKKIELNQEINNNLEQQAQAIFLKMFPDIFSASASSSFQNLIEFSNGKKRPETIGNIPVYGGNGVLAYTNQSNAENCVIIGRVGAYCGNTFLCPEKCWTSDNAIQAKSKNEDSPLFIYYLLRNASLPSRHIGTGQPLMTQAILNAIPVNEPSTQEIRSFINICTPLHETIFANEKQNISLALLRDTLLPKLMSGELDVSDIDL